MGAALSGCLCQTTGGGCGVWLGMAQSPRGTQSLCGVQRAGGAQSLGAWHPGVQGVGSTSTLFVGKKNRWQQLSGVPPLGVPCLPQFKWSNFQLFPVLHTQRFCSGLLQVTSPLVVPSFLFTSYEQGFRRAAHNCTLCVGLGLAPSHQAV